MRISSPLHIESMTNLPLIARQTLLITFLLCIRLSAAAQDLVVTDKNDSINCKITKASKDFVYFKGFIEGELRNVFLPIRQVKDYKYNYYQKSAEDLSNMSAKSKSPVGLNPNKLFAFTSPRYSYGVGAGMGYQIAPLAPGIPQGFSDYYQNLKLGLQISAQGSYQFTKMMGLGLTVSRFSTKSGPVEVTATHRQTGQVRNGKLSDRIAVTSIYPHYQLRFVSKKGNNALTMGFGLGVGLYRNFFTLIDPFTIRGQYVCSGIDVNYDLMVSHNSAVGIQLSLKSGAMNRITITDATGKTAAETLSTPEGLSRLDLSICYRWYKKGNR